jgi:hypothetical protein
VKNSNNGKEVVNKDVKLEAKSPNHSLFHCNKKHFLKNAEKKSYQIHTLIIENFLTLSLVSMV